MKFLLLLLIGYIGLTLLVWHYQRSLMYLPMRNMEPPAYYGLKNFTAEKLVAEDGTELTAWYAPAREGMPTIIYLHGNGGHLGYRAGVYHGFAEEGFGVIALSWRGYGTSTGSPTEEGLYQDARAAIAFAEKHGLALKQLIYYGESLGTGVAVQMAMETKPGAVVLYAPYTSIVQRAAEIYFFLPARWLVKDRFDSLGKIHNVEAPLLILHGEPDTIVPVTHGKKMLEAANEPKKGVFFPDLGHNDLVPQRFVPEVLKFCQEQGLIKKAAAP